MQKLVVPKIELKAESPFKYPGQAGDDEKLNWGHVRGMETEETRLVNIYEEKSTRKV